MVRWQMYGPVGSSFMFLWQDIFPLMKWISLLYTVRHGLYYCCSANINTSSCKVSCHDRIILFTSLCQTLSRSFSVNLTCCVLVSDLCTIFLIRFPFLSTFCLQIDNADFSCPSYFALGAKALIRRILDPNPETVSF